MRQDLKDNLALICIGSLSASFISVALFFGFITGVLNIYPLAIFWGLLVLLSILSDFRFKATISKKDTTDNGNRRPFKYFPFQGTIKVYRNIASSSERHPITGIQINIYSVIGKPNYTNDFSNQPPIHTDTLTQEKHAINQKRT